MRLFLTIALLAVASAASAQAPNRFTTNLKSRILVIDNPTAKKVDVTIDGIFFTSYLYGAELKKPSLYPIMSPKGNFITRGWPLAPRPGERVDHPHHLGLWMNFGDLNGVDFWNNSNSIGPEHKGPFGTVRHKAVLKARGGSQVGTLDVVSEWVGPDGNVMLLDTTYFRFTGQGTDRQIDRRTVLKAIGKNANFRDNKEGFMGLRLCRQLEHPSTKPEVYTDANGAATAVPAMNNAGVTGLYTNSEDLKGDSVWGKPAEWCMVNGVVNNEPLTVLMIDHPKNPGFPAFWHARPYGLFAINPLGASVFSNGAVEMNLSIPAGKTVTFQYGIEIQSGRQLKADDAERKFAQFSAPDED